MGKECGSKVGKDECGSKLRGEGMWQESVGEMWEQREGEML